MAEANPFDAYGDPEAIPAAEGLQPGPDPSLFESFKQNLLPLVGGVSSIPRNIFDTRTIRKADEEGVAQPGDSPFAGRPSQTEVDAARQRHAQAKAEHDAYESFHSDTVGGKAAGLLGGLLGGLADPVNLVGGGGILLRGGAALAGRFGLSGPMAQAFGTAIEAGALNAGIDVATQTGKRAADIQEEPYSPAQTAGAAAIGAGFGLGMHGVVAGMNAAISARTATRAAENARIDQYLGVRDFQTGRDAAAVREAPALDAVAEQTARALRAVPDETLRKVAQSADTVEGAVPDQRVAVPVSAEEATTLRQAGVDIDDNGTMPATAVETIRQEEARRAEPAESVQSGPSTAESPEAAPQAVTPDNARAEPAVGRGEAVQPEQLPEIAVTRGEERQTALASRPMSREVGGVTVRFPDADHEALFAFGERVRSGQRPDPAEARRLFERFKGYAETDPGAGIRFDNWRDLGATARDYFDHVTEEAARGRPLTAEDVISPDRRADWQRRQIDEMRSAVTPDAADARAKLDEADANPKAIAPASAAESAPATPGKSAGVFMFPARDLKVDPERFQFKSDGDVEGVTNKLRGVTEWDPARANQVIVWQDKDGQLFVADGHQRTGLARRLSKDGQPPIEVPGLLYRESDGFSAQDVMVIAAEKNIGEGSGSILDAAKIMRVSPDSARSLAGISDYRIRQAVDLSRLGDEPWRMVVNDVVTPEQGAIVGRAIRDDAPRQVAAIDAIRRFEARGAEETAALVAKVSNAELSKAERGAQGGLFGDEPATSTVMEEVRIVAAAIRELKRDKALFSRVLNDADRIESAGSSINRKTAGAVRDDAERIAAYVASRSDTPGPIRDAVKGLAREVKDGSRSYADAARALVENVSREIGRNDTARPAPGRGAPAELAGGATERTAAGDQTLIPGVQPVTERQRLEAQGAKPLQGGNKELGADSLFGDGHLQDDLLDRAQPLRRSGPPAVTNPDARFPARRELAGEGGKPNQLPAGTTPEEVAAFRVTDAMRSIAERMGRKLEVDGRFTAKGALGEYKPKEGVLRIRQEGDFEVFAHELGHAVDQDLKNNKAATAEWTALKRQHKDELRALDANTADPTKQTVAEGAAEFLRSYITNPAYARHVAPNVADAFERTVLAKRPDMAAVLADASRISQIDNGMAPVDAMRSMVVSGVEKRGFAKFNAERKELGITPTLGLWFDRFYAGVFGKDHWIKRFTDQLRDAQFQKTGKPLPEFNQADPYKAFRMLPGARQAAMDGIYHGVRGYGRTLAGPESPSLFGALEKAFGSVTLVDNPDDPLVKSFSAYLVARRSAALYDRWKAGLLRNPPVRASENQVRAAITEFEKAHPQFKDAADDVFGFASAMWRKKFEAGLITREVYETVAGRGDDYVPFYRDMRDGKASGGAGGGAAGQERSALKRIKGSTRDIIDPIHSLAFDAAQTERIIAENDAWKAMHRLAQTGGEFSGRFMERVPNSEVRAQSVDLAEGLRNAAKNAGLTKADADTIIAHMEQMIGQDLSATVFKRTETTARGERLAFYWDAGERVALKVGDNEYSRQMYDMMTMMSSQERDIMFAMMGKVNGLFSQFITNAPQFALKNLVMDNMSRVFIARHTGILGRLPGASIVAGIYTQILDREFAKSYAAMGGIRGGIVSAAVRDLDEAKGLKALTLKPQGLKGELVKLVHNPLHALEMVMRGVETTETMGRLGQAKIVFRHLKKQGLSDEEAFGAAIYEARDILDYDRRGWAVTSAARFLPFYNAGLQGTDRSARSLFGAPFQAAVESYRRGGYANLDAASRTALSDAVKNWGVIAAGIVGTMGYAAYMADDPVYQRMSEYMRRRYFIFPGGEDKDGKINIITLPKPFDHAGGIFGAVEAAMYGFRRADPETWSKIVTNLKEGFVPRQVSSLPDFINSLPPAIKVPFEVLTGQKLGFDGGPSFPIVPMNLKALPPEMQFTGTTSWLAKKMGQWFGISPLVAEHVAYGMGATAVRDANQVVTAMFDNQPNVTMKDAMRQMFFGGLYREQRGGGGFRSDLMQIMGRENGQYVTAAAGYTRAIEDGDADQAAAIYARGNDLAKTIMTIRAGSYGPDLRQLHPLERTAAIGDILSKVTRDLARSRVEVLDRSRKRGEERDYIDLAPTTARALANTIGALAAEEIRNGLTIAKQPGYEGFPLIDTKARYDAIRALSPEVADELKKRLGKAHVLPLETVQKAWPQLKDRLLKDREQAKIADLKRLR